MKMAKSVPPSSSASFLDDTPLQRQEQTQPISCSQSSVRFLAPKYSACSLFDKKGTSHMVSLTFAPCQSGTWDHFSFTSQLPPRIQPNKPVTVNMKMKRDQNAGLGDLDLVDLHPSDAVVTKGAVPEAETLPKPLSIPDVMNCSCCQINFGNRKEQVSHYKCDWHRYNLHLHLRGQKGISEDDFERIAASSDVSSISGSDDDEDEEATSENSSHLTIKESAGEDTVGESDVPLQRKLHKVFFKNASGELISMYRCLLHHKKSPLSGAEEMVRAAMEAPKHTKWIVIMVSAGHFAAAVFDGNEVLEHKTFHRYTVRAKRGTAQSMRDSQGKFAKSAGAHLRRYNEAALGQDVSELMKNWAAHLTSCDLIFVRIPVHNRGIFYGSKNPILKKDDSRIRIIPFPTRRPTFNEVKRVQQMLASVESYGQASEIGNVLPYSPPRVYVPETGELQLREPRPMKKAKFKNPKQEAHISSQLQQSDEISGQSPKAEPSDKEEEDNAVDGTDMDLVEVLQTVSFSHLKEYDTNLSPKKKNKKKKKEVVEKIDDAPEIDEEKMRWQNKLFTACKTGNLDSLNCLIVEMKESPTSSQSKPGVTTTENTPTKSVSNGEVIAVSCETSEDSIMDKVKTMTLDCDDRCTAITSQNPTEVSEKMEDPAQISSLLTEVLNKPMGDQSSTFLHVSSKHGHSDIVWALLEAGADPAIKDKSGKTAYNFGETEVRNTFRRFMASYPYRYDYAKAQVPSPLTAEMEAEKKQKNAEKRKQKKKALNERQKEKKAMEAKDREENRERERFLALSEREKRALAAERRFLQQSEQNGARPVLSRCWECGTDITGKVPFEYADYKFCTTKCLREHRAKSSTAS